MKKTIAAAIIAVVLFAGLVLVGNTPDSQARRARPQVRIGTAVCVVRTVSDVQPCPTN